MKKLMTFLFFGLVSGLAFGQAGVVTGNAQYLLPSPCTILLISAGTTFFTMLKK